MRVQNINNTNRNYSTLRSRNIGQNNKPSFGKNFGSLMTEALSQDFNVKSYRKVNSMFNNLIESAKSEGRVVNKTAFKHLEDCSEFMRIRLRGFKKDYKADKFEHGDSIIEKGSTPIVSVYDRGVSFTKPYSDNNFKDSIIYRFEDDGVTVQRAYDKTAFFNNYNVKSYRTYSEDYSSSEVECYQRDKDGEVDNWKSFWTGMFTT